MWDWLKSLWSSAKSLISRIYEAFLNWIIYMVEEVYSAFLASVLLTYFAYVVVLYVMFYVENGYTMMEIWNPSEKQPQSKVLKYDRAPQGVNKPNRNEAKVLSATQH